MTDTKTFSIREALDEANPTLLPSALQQYKLGKLGKMIKATITGLTSGATFDITAIPAADIDINQGPDDIVSSGILPPIGSLISLRVTAGTTYVGTYALTDPDGDLLTAATHTVVGAASLSDDGKTLVFPGSITAFIIQYYSVPLVTLQNGVWTQTDVNQEFGQPGGGIGDE